MALAERPLADASLETVIEGLRDATPEAATPFYQEIVRRFEPLLRKAWRHLPPPADYQDFVQDVFVRLFGGLARLRDLRRFPGYFQRCVQSTVVDALRHRRPLEEPLSERDLRIASRVDEEILTAVFLQSYLHLLAPSERSVLQLEWVDGLAPAEVARTLGLSPGGARAAKSRGISKLKQIIELEARALDASGERTKQK